MDAIGAYFTARLHRAAAAGTRRWLPVLVVMALVAPLFGMLVLGGLIGSVTGRDDRPRQPAVVEPDCTAGGAQVAGMIRARWNGRPFTPHQVRNAQTIVAVGRQKGIPPYGWLVAVAAAMTESRLENIAYGDRDSVGLFQMRPSMGWGTSAQLTDPVYAAGKFYDVMLDEVPRWQSMSVNDAAQAVERSAFPWRYGLNEAAARALVSDPVVLGASCGSGTGTGAGTTVQQRVVAAAMARLGTPYSWGGGDFRGATYGIDHGAKTLGFDCSGLTGYAWYQGTGGSVAMDTFTGSQEAATVPVSKEHIQAGDLLFFPGHVGLYDGRGGMIHAPHTGTVVQVAHDILSNAYWMARLRFIGRPKAYLAATANLTTSTVPPAPSARPVPSVSVTASTPTDPSSPAAPLPVPTSTQVPPTAAPTRREPT